jgi:hypothetical protein
MKVKNFWVWLKFSLVHNKFLGRYAKKWIFHQNSTTSSLTGTEWYLALARLSFHVWNRKPSAFNYVTQLRSLVINYLPFKCSMLAINIILFFLKRFPMTYFIFSLRNRLFRKEDPYFYCLHWILLTRKSGKNECPISQLMIPDKLRTTIDFLTLLPKRHLPNFYWISRRNPKLMFGMRNERRKKNYAKNRNVVSSMHVL